MCGAFIQKYFKNTRSPFDYPVLEWYLAMYTILKLQLFSFSILKILFHCLLASIVLRELTIIIPLLVIPFSSIVIPFLFFSFSSSAVFLWQLYLPISFYLSCLEFADHLKAETQFFNQFGASFNYCVLKHCLSSIISMLFFWILNLI